MIAVVFATLVVATGSPAKAATRTSGVYLTAADYQNVQLTQAGECSADKRTHKVELRDFLNRPFIHVTHDGVRREYLKSQIYGFRACDGRDYRFVEGREYRILEAASVVLYSLDQSLGRTRMRLYFFQ